MSNWKLAFVLILPLCSTPVLGTQPSPAAIEAYKRAVTAVEKRQANGNTTPAQLNCPATGEHASTIAAERLPVQDSDGHPLHPDGALIHHWGAAIFIEHVGAGDVISLLQDYDHHANVYAPEVTYSKLIDKQGSRYHVVHESLSRNLLTVGLRIESIIEWSGDEQRGFSSHATTIRVNEIEHAGTPRARLRSPDQAKGWMWAENSWWHVIPKTNGVCLTYEAITLTRDIPWGLRWLVRPMAEHFPAETLSTMLQRTRAAVRSREDAKEAPHVFSSSDHSFQEPLRYRN
jgi:hypothetical protein